MTAGVGADVPPFPVFSARDFATVDRDISQCFLSLLMKCKYDTCFSFLWRNTKKKYVLGCHLVGALNMALAVVMTTNYRKISALVVPIHCAQY